MNIVSNKRNKITHVVVVVEVVVGGVVEVVVGFSVVLDVGTGSGSNDSIIKASTLNFPFSVRYQFVKLTESVIPTKRQSINLKIITM